MILAHDNLSQLNTLISLLDHPRNDIYVHIDRKSGLMENDIQIPEESGFYIHKAISIYWSDVSLVEAELFILAQAVANGPYQYYHLISGSDLPIKNQDYILDFYDKNSGKEFVEYQIPGKFLDKEYYERIKYYHVFSKHYRSGNKAKDYFFIGIEYFCIFWQWIFRVNRIPKNFTWARGSQWFDITDELAAYILEKREWIMHQFRMTRAADESFLPLLVHNSKFVDRLYRKTFDGDMHANMRFIDWSRGDPYLFTSKDFDDLMTSDFLFARKFDEKKDADIIKKIAEAVHCKKEE